MKLKGIHVHKFHELTKKEFGLHIGPEQLSDGINLIYGQNGSGKTTLAQAILALIWPQKEKHSQALIDGTLEICEDQWNIHVYGGNQTVKSAKGDDRKLEMPPSDWERRYFLSLHELLVVDDKDLLKVIRNEINGGIDLYEAKKKLKFDEMLATHKNREVGNLKKAKEDVKKITTEHRSLQDEERSLEAIQKEEQALADIKLNLDRLKKSIRHRKAVIEMDSLQLKLQVYDPILDSISSDDELKVKELEKNLLNCTQQLSLLQEMKSSAELELKQLGLPNIPDDTEFYTLQENLRMLHDLTDKIQEVEQELAGWISREKTSREAINSEISNEDLWMLDKEGMNALNEWQQLVFSYTAEKDFFELVSGLEYKLEDQPYSETYIERLIEWLGKPDKIMPHFATIGYLVFLISALSYQIYHTFLDPQLENNILTTTLAIATIGLCYLSFKYLKSLKGKAEIPLTREEGREELNKLITLKQKKMFSDQHAMFVSMKKELHKDNLHKKEEQLDRYERECLSKYSICLQRDNFALMMLIDKLRAWKEADLNKTMLAGRLEKAQEHFQDMLTACNAFFDPFYPRKAETHAQASAFDRDLQLKVIKSKEYQQKINECQYKIDHHNKEFADQTDKLIYLYTSKSCLSSRKDLQEAKQKLIHYISQKDEYDALKNRFKAAASQLEDSNEGLDLTTNLHDLERQLELAQNVDTDLQRIREKIVQIKTRIDSAKSRHDLADALRAKAEASEELQHLYETVIRSCIGSKLISYLVENSTRHASKVLKRARELFGLITHHRFELLVTENSDSHFLAKETSTGHILQLNQLSSGTRIQLLLSVRVAFIEIQEGFHPQMPILLDEVLGNSDDERTYAIIEAVASLAREGRQIFYFTAQSDEVDRWLHFLKNAGNVPYKQPIVLPSGVFESQALKAITETVIPSPEGLTHEEYGKLLNVPPISDEHVHLWYLIKDLNTLYACLKLGYTYWSQILSYIKIHGKDSFEKILPKNECNSLAKADAIAKSLKKGYELKKKGHGAKIDEVILTNSGCISEAYLQQIIELNNQTGGQPKLLIQKLEDKAIPRYRKERIEELKTYFIANHMIDENEPLTQEEIHRELDAFVANHNFIQDELLTYDMLQEIKNLL